MERRHCLVLVFVLFLITRKKEDEIVPILDMGSSVCFKKEKKQYIVVVGMRALHNTNE